MTQPNQPDPIGEILNKLVAWALQNHLYGEQAEMLSQAEAKAAIQQLMLRERLEASDEGFREGQRVGQHQAADKLYRDVIHIYMFRDGDKKATAIADSSATDLLKACEKYLNHNGKVYRAYVRGERYARLHASQAQLLEAADQHKPNQESETI